MESMTTGEKRQWIASQQLFQGVPAEVVDALAPLFRPRTFPAHTLVVLESQNSNSLSLIVKGTVKISLARPTRETLLNICGPGEVLGEVNLLDGGGHSADIGTLEETALFWIHKEPMAECMDKYPRLGTNIARILSRRLRLATSRIEALTTLDVPGRVSKQLCIFAEEYGQKQKNGDILIPLCLTQSDLGALLGASRPRVNQVLSLLKKDEIIHIGKNQHITVLDLVELEKRSVE